MMLWLYASAPAGTARTDARVVTQTHREAMEQVIITSVVARCARMLTLHSAPSPASVTGATCVRCLPRLAGRIRTNSALLPTDCRVPLGQQSWEPNRHPCLQSRWTCLLDCSRPAWLRCDCGQQPRDVLQWQLGLSRHMGIGGAGGLLWVRGTRGPRFADRHANSRRRLALRGVLHDT